MFQVIMIDKATGESCVYSTYNTSIVALRESVSLTKLWKGEFAFHTKLIG